MGVRPGGRRSQRGRPIPPDVDYDREPDRRLSLDDEPWLDEEQKCEEADWPCRKLYTYKGKR